MCWASRGAKHQLHTSFESKPRLDQFRNTALWRHFFTSIIYSNAWFGLPICDYRAAEAYSASIWTKVLFTKSGVRSINSWGSLVQLESGRQVVNVQARRVLLVYETSISSTSVHKNKSAKIPWSLDSLWTEVIPFSQRIILKIFPNFLKFLGCLNHLSFLDNNKCLAVGKTFRSQAVGGVLVHFIGPLNQISRFSGQAMPDA